jgi:hypothetical protein
VVEIDGDRAKVEEIKRRILVPDLDPDRTLRFDEDRERWARFLPAALRGPYLTATCEQEFPTPAAIRNLDGQVSATNS